MQPKNLLFAFLTSTLVLGAAVGHYNQEKPRLRELPGDPTRAEVELLEARAFVLDEPFVHTWRKEQPTFTGGYLLVLRSDPALVQRRQLAEPVLYVGSEVAERVSGGEAGYLVCLVPAPVDATGIVQLDPTTAPIWFGEPDLPERIDAPRARAELRRALRRGVRSAANPDGLQRVSVDQTVFARDRSELDLVIADLIERWSPSERSLAESLRVR